MYRGSIKVSSPCGRPRNGWHDEVAIDFNEKRISVWEEMALDKKVVPNNESPMGLSCPEEGSGVGE